MKRAFIAVLAVTLAVLISGVFADTYPQFDISGFKKWSYYRVQAEPMSNYFIALTQLGGQSQNALAGQWQERLTLKIDSKLNDHLGVSYNILQEPDTPQVSDVKVKYDNTELTFGDFTASFSGNEFVSATKYLNGVMLTSSGDNYTFTLVPSTKLKSNNQPISTVIGNNTRGPYSLGHGSILESSEKILLNNIPLTRGTDYTIDYFEGKITFARILTAADQFTYTYEFTNLFDLFFPTVSKRDFFGVQGSYTSKRMFFEKAEVIPSMPISYEANDEFPTSFSYSDAGPVVVPATGESGYLTSTEAAPSSAETLKPEFVRPSFISEEAMGLYRLKHFPVVEYSESVYHKGTLLKKYEDYVIDYTYGTITAMLEDMPTSDDTLSVKYSYYNVSGESEVISGIDSKGPYEMTEYPVVKNSERIEVDGKKNFRGLDYTIDYNSGKITFNTKINAASKINASYSFVIHTDALVPPSKSSFTLGATYLKESAKKGSAAATATLVEARKGSEITNNLLNLKHFPLDPSQTVSVTVNGTPFADFYVPTSEAIGLHMPYLNDKDDASDGYATGTLKFTSTLDASADIAVNYVYKKSIYGKFSGRGNGSTGPYYLTSINSVVPATDTNMQVRTDGSSVIDTFTRNSSREVADGKYKINYNFPYTPYITFNDPFPNQKKFDITFYYIPASASVQDSDINHDVTGVNTNITIGPDTVIDAAVGISRTDQVIMSESTQDTIIGNNTRGPYSLSHNNIIEGSEKVFLNNFQMNKDVDYFMNYQSGQLSFYYLTIKPADTMVIQYDYQSSSGISTGSTVKTGAAYRVNAATKAGPFSVGAYIKEINADYTPFESTNIGTGSQQKRIDLGYSSGESLSVASSILETKSQIGTYTGYYTWNTDRNIGIGVNPKGLVQINMNFRNYKVMDDILPGSTTHQSNNITNSLAFSVVPKSVDSKYVAFTNREDFSKSETTNFLDDSGSTVGFFHTANTLNVAKRLGLGYEFQYSEPKNHTSEGVTYCEISRDSTYNADWDLTFGFLKKFSTRARLIQHDQLNALTLAKVFTKNESYNVVLDPLSNLSATYDKNRTETLSVQADQENPNTEKDNYSVRFTPFSVLSLAYGRSDDKSLQEAGTRSKGVAKNVSVDFTPFSFLKLGSRWDTQERQSSAPSGSSEIITDLNSETKNFNGSITPFGLFTLNSDYIIEDYNNNTSDGIITTKTENTTLKYGLSFSPVSILSFSGNYAMKTTKDLILNAERPKENLDAQTTLKIFSWGSLVYNWQQERNKGEVQAGVVTNLDILKVTNSYSFNITLPQESLILSSIVLSATYKEVDYTDYLISSNNFRANMMTFEGTINF
ncbi:MAG: hypothetical protein NTZ10_06130 [Candidatus Saganbacteria bacterium]|nr:hypothetical protein [Candidatus Saganbacteria bacterium]